MIHITSNYGRIGPFFWFNTLNLQAEVTDTSTGEMKQYDFYIWGAYKWFSPSTPDPQGFSFKQP